jgi:hypothetical protein
VLYDAVVFTLLVEDEQGCVSDPDNVLINTEGPALAATPFTETPEICRGETVAVSANATGGGGEYTYQWTSDPPGFTSDQAGFTDSPNQDIRYDLVLTDQFDNQVSAHINITVNQLPQIDLIPQGTPVYGEDSIIVCVRDSVWLDAGQDEDPQGTVYFWNSNYEGRYYRATTNGNWIDIQTHAVEVEHGVTGCRNEEQITILFDYNQCEIFIPETTYSPGLDIDLYPNPNSGLFTLTLNEDLRDVRVLIFDIGGRMVYQKDWQGQLPTGEQKRFNTEQLEEGVYFVQITSGNKTANKRMVIQ